MLHRLVVKNQMIQNFMNVLTHRSGYIDVNSSHLSPGKILRFKTKDKVK